MENYAAIRKETIERGWTDPELKKINLACEAVLDRVYDEQGARLTRIEELIEYETVLGYKRLGLAFCVGLFQEAKALTEVLEAHGFAVVSVGCMAGGTSKTALGLTRLKDRGSMVCNPIMQAVVLNAAATELNIMLGLCIGHDVLFIKSSKADVTPIAVKDRVACHNPLGVLYTRHSYYRKRLFARDQ
jgi:uncharacterized metal-binding protein